MTDIVERLRKWSVFGYGHEASCDMKEAATEIEHQRTVVATAARSLSEQTLILDALRAENERLRAALREAYEVYAGSEGFIPKTCAEGYQQQIIKQMVKIISAALEDR